MQEGARYTREISKVWLVWDSRCVRQKLGENVIMLDVDVSRQPDEEGSKMEFHCFCRQGGVRWEESWSENIAQGTLRTRCSNVIGRTEWGHVDGKPRRHFGCSLIKSKAMEFLAGVGIIGRKRSQDTVILLFISRGFLEVSSAAIYWASIVCSG